MTAMPPLRDILNNTPADAINVDFNFNTIEAHVANEVINRDGSVAMTGPLSLSGPPTAPQHAVTKQYADTSVIPVGTIWEFAGASAPAGWALCDGASKSTTDPIYAALFAVIQYAYGGSLANFNLPDRRGRVGVGRNAGDALFGALGQAGGSRDLIIPNHTHPITNHYHIMPHTHGTPNHQHTMQTGNESVDHTHEQAVITMVDNPSGTSDYLFQTGPSYGMSANAHVQTLGRSVPHTHSGTTDTGQGSGTSTQPSNPNTDWGGTPNTNNPTGGAAPANGNIPPYVTVNYIIRIG